MQTVLIEIKNSNALAELQYLQDKNLITIVNEDFTSYALPGKSITDQECNDWIEKAEKAPTINLSDAKQQWEARKTIIQSHIQ